MSSEPSLAARMRRWEQDRRERVEALRQSLAESLDYFGRIGARKVVLFGSFLDGPRAFSDLDLLIVMPDGKTSAEWTNELYRDTPRSVATDLLVYNETDFRLMAACSRFVRHALRSGKVIHETTSD